MIYKRLFPLRARRAGTFRLTDDDPETLVRNGAPYHIKDIVSDMEVAEEMVYQLYTALNEIF